MSFNKSICLCINKKNPGKWNAWILFVCKNVYCLVYVAILYDCSEDSTYLVKMHNVKKITFKILCDMHKNLETTG